MARPTIADIAERAGVSKGAVSFALNGRPGVSEETRRRILAVADEMNWRPHRAARSLGNSRAGAVGLILSRPARTLGLEPFFGQIVSGLQAGLAEDGTALQLLVVDDPEAEMAAYRNWTAEQRVDGFVLLDPLIDDPRFAALEALEVPVMVLGGPLEDTSLSFSWADDSEAMHEAVDYLAALGHRHVVHVAGMPQFLHTKRRMDVLTEAKERHELAEVVSIPTDYSDSEGAVITRRVLSRRERPTAIVYDSDVMAVAGLGVAMEMGVSVPGDLSIVAFDDSILTQLMHPALTALSRDTFEFGRQAAEVLLEVVADPTKVVNLRTADPVLTVRESTAPPS